MGQLHTELGDLSEIELEFLSGVHKRDARAQRVDEKNRVIRLVMFTPRVMVIKMSKMLYFMYFLLHTAKNQSQFGQDI